MQGYISISEMRNEKESEGWRERKKMKSSENP
jgi:hypothetical protein